jgi:SAM-dependent methyltransferase
MPLTQEYNVDYWDEVNDVPEALDKICATWDKDTATLYDVDRILQNLPTHPSWRVLEIGCGVGRLIKPLREKFAIVDGIDFSQKMVDLSYEYLRSGRVWKNDGRTLPMADATYDFIFSFTVFQHIRSSIVLASYLREMFRVVRPGGYVRFQLHDLSDPTFGRWEEDLSQVWGNSYTADELRGMLMVLQFTDIDIKEESPWIWCTAKRPN